MTQDQIREQVEYALYEFWSKYSKENKAENRDEVISRSIDEVCKIVSEAVKAREKEIMEMIESAKTQFGMARKWGINKSGINFALSSLISSICDHPSGYSKDGYDICGRCGTKVAGDGTIPPMDGSSLKSSILSDNDKSHE